MTNPRGRCFISYKRSPEKRLNQAVRLRDALRDRGVPTWRDVDNLESKPAEAELRRVIADPDTAGAVMLVVPEVAYSAMIRRAEAPAIFQRYDADNGFYVKIVLSGVEYAEVDNVLGNPARARDLAGWNLHKLPSDLLNDARAALIAKDILRVRLRTISTSATELTVGFFTRTGDKSTTYDLSLDYTSYFDGRAQSPNTFKRIQSALVDVAAVLLTEGLPRRLICESRASIPAGVLFGSVFSGLAGFNVIWRQPPRQGAPEDWALTVPPSDAKLSIETNHRDLDASSIAVCLSLNQPVETAASDFLRANGIKPRAFVLAALSEGPLKQSRTISPADGVAFANQIVDAIKEAKADLGLSSVEVHLFLACPLALAVLLGQLLNTLGTCHIYDYDTSRSPNYVHVHSFNPSAITYAV